MALRNINATYNLPAPKLKLTLASGSLTYIQRSAGSAIRAGLSDAQPFVIESLRKALDASMDAKVWSWPRQTLRQNGSAPGTPRDIVDTGQLKSSLTMQPKIGRSMLTISGSYTAPHALITHNGGYIQPWGNMNAKTVYLPPRRWVKYTLQGGGPVKQYDPSDIVRDSIVKAWNNVFGQ